MISATGSLSKGVYTKNMIPVSGYSICSMRAASLLTKKEADIASFIIYEALSRVPA
jgi:uncharacterized protein YegJ (DUF2314 family)